MESLQGLTNVVGATRVSERNGGNRGAADAFRRALQQQAGEQEQSAGAGGDQPLGTRLQRRAADGRKDGGAALHHVDVIA